MKALPFCVYPALYLANLLSSLQAFAGEEHQKVHTNNQSTPRIKIAQGSGITLTSPDELFSFQAKARLQMRATFHKAEQNSFDAEIKTMRLWISGHIGTPSLKYNVQLAFGASDFETGIASPVFDAWLQYDAHRDFQLRVGQFFVPFDRARTVKEASLQLVDRAQLVSEFNLDRDMGLMLFSNDVGGHGEMFNYSLGVFGGAGKNRFQAEELGFLTVARLGFKPFGKMDDDFEGDSFRSSKPKLALGGALAYNGNTNRERSTLGAVFQNGSVNYFHAAADMVLKYKGFYALSEVLYRVSPQDKLEAKEANNSSQNKSAEYTRSGWGYLVQAGFMLTPKLEGAVRWNQMYAAKDTSPAFQALTSKQGNELGIGFNYYIHSYFFRIQADYAARWRDGAPEHLLRTQLDMTF